MSSYLLEIKFEILKEDVVLAANAYCVLPKDIIDLSNALAPVVKRISRSASDAEFRVRVLAGALV